MGERLHLPVPMWIAQCQLLGGFRRIILVMLLCAGALTLGFFGFARVTPEDPLSVVAGRVLLAMPPIAGFILVLGGCGALSRAILRDHTTHMRDSHRLSPMSSSAVVLGYLFGSTFQMLAVFAVLLAFGCVLTLTAGGGIGKWIGGCLLMLNGAITLWSLTIVVGMRSQSPVSLGGIIFGGVVVSNAGLIMLPAVGVFSGVYAAVVGSSLAMGRGFSNTPTVVAVMIVHFILTFFWIGTAATKYRRPDLPCLQAGRGLMMLTLFTGFGTAGILVFELATSAAGDTNLGLFTFQWCATLALSLLVAMIPVNGAMECRRLAALGTAMRTRLDHVHDLLVAFVAPTIVIALMMIVGWDVWNPLLRDAAAGPEFEPYAARVWLITIASCYAFVLGARGAICVCRRWFRSFRLVALSLLIVLWVALPGADLGFAAARQESYYDPIVTTFSFSQSPFGSIVLLWTEVRGPALAGVIAQVGLALLLTGLSLLPKFRLGSRPTPEAHNPAR